MNNQASITTRRITADNRFLSNRAKRCLVIGACLWVIPAFAQDPEAEALLNRNQTIETALEGAGAVNAQKPVNGNGSEPIEVNGDQVEYGANSKEVIATGNVVVIYKGTKISCDKLIVNSQTKVGKAFGHVRLDDSKGIIECQEMTYDFQAKSGVMADASFRAAPYFGRAKNIERPSDKQFTAFSGYMTTCSVDQPHYRIASKKVNVFPKDKVQTKDDVVYFGKIPALYLPQYNRSLKDPLMHVQVSPGTSKEWGAYILTAWRFNLTQYIDSRIYADYRANKGLAEGFGADYDFPRFGKGDFKFYYTQERDALLNKTNRNNRKFERWFIRFRYKWQIDEKTDLISEYYKITDSKRATKGPEYNIFKDYFYREYEKDSLPTSYLQIHRPFQYSSLDVMLQKRTNRWYPGGYLEKLPELLYSMPSLEILGLPKFMNSLVYLENSTSAGNYNKKNTSSSTPDTNHLTPDAHVNRMDTSNKVSFPMKAAFVQLTPFATSRQTFYSKDIHDNSIAPRSIFYYGADMSTKFYRVFNLKLNTFGLEINGLRHIITPTIAYSYNRDATIKSDRLRQVDGVDSLGGRNNSAALGLSNKLQTKRQGQSVDLVDFLVTSTYTFKPKTGDKRGSSYSDILFDLKVLPFSWLSVNMDATYKHSGSSSGDNYNTFSNINYDFSFNLGPERTFNFGQRYVRKGSNENTYDFKWRMNPKWAFSIYQRYERGRDTSLKRGLREQEYSISRDLHCWAMELRYNVKRSVGETIWLVFRLKAFPEIEFGYDQNYHQPKPGSQSNP
ncbi:MAG: LptA/OstA family protein [Candidatus Omnitrophota bacterium]